MLRRLLPLAAVSAVFVAPAAATAAPVVSPAIALTSTPSHVVGAPDGSAWVSTSDILGQDLLHVTADGAVEPFDLPGAGTVGLTFGPDGALWATRTGGVVRITPTSPPNAQAFPVADIADPRGIVTGPDGNLWTGSGSKLIRITTAGVATSFPTGATQARDIAATATGTVLADLGGDLIRADTAGAVTTTPVGAGAQGVAVAPSGQIAVTSSQTDPHRVTLLGPDHVIPTPGDPFGVTFAEDGAFWVARFGADAVDRIAPDGTSTTFALEAGAGPRQLATAPGGRLWVVADIAKTIRRIDGVVAPVVTPPPPAGPTTPTGPVTPTGPAKLDFTLRLKRKAPARKGDARVVVVTSRAASVKLTLRRELRGRRNRKGTCVRSTSAPSGKRCVRRVLVLKTKTVGTAAGTARVVRFTKVAKGTYLVRAVASALGTVRTRTVRRVRVR